MEMPTAERIRPPTWNPEFITDISEKVYRRKLDQECGSGTADMPRKAGSMSIRDRAKAYDRLTRMYLDELGFKPPAP
jgi:hypothetical protein